MRPFRPRPDARRVPLPAGGAIVLHRNGEALVVLNASAHYLWRILARGERACLPAALVSRFGLSPERAQQDAAAVVDDWVEQALVSDAEGNFRHADIAPARDATNTQDDAETRCFRLAGLTIMVAAPGWIAQRLSFLGTPVDDPRNPAQLVCRFDLPPGGPGNLTVDGECRLAAQPAEVLIGAFYEVLIKRLRPGVEWQAMIHAGAVAWRGRAAILAAPSGSGKSTLIAYLVTQGFDYLADDLVPLRADDHSIAPFPMPISVKPGSVAALAPYRALDTDRADGEQLLFQDVAFDGPCCPAMALVFPRYSADEPARCIEVSVEDALVRLLSDRIHFGVTIRPEALTGFVGWLRGIRIRELVYSDFSEARRWMTDVLTA